jgi:hypothetical protein
MAVCFGTKAPTFRGKLLPHLSGLSAVDVEECGFSKTLITVKFNISAPQY